MARINKLICAAASVSWLGMLVPRADGQVVGVRHEIVRGVVLTADSGAPVQKATITATRVSDRVAKLAETGAAGEFSIDWPDGDGEYAVMATASGFDAATSHAVRAGSDSVLTVAIRLTKTPPVTQLAAVVTVASRPQPQRDAAGRAEVVATEVVGIPQNAARRLDPALAGDLSAIAGLAPGVLPVSGGISVLGLATNQNSVTLNGFAFAGATIPRDAYTRVRVSSSSYDPSNGWFSGAHTQVDLVPGDLFTQRNAHLTVDAPPAQWSDPVSARLGQRFTNINASVGGMGQLVDDVWSYNYGIQGGRKVSSVATLGSASADLLARAGVAADSASRLFKEFASAGIPFSGGAASDVVNDEISFIGRLDHAPFNWQTLEPSATTWGVTGYAKVARAEGQGTGPTTTKSYAGQTTQQLASIAGEWSTYVRREVLMDLRSSVSSSSAARQPSLGLPSGTVLVASDIPGNVGGISNLGFGGNSTIGNDSRAYTWESVADVQWYPPGQAAHKLRLTADARLDASSRNSSAGEFGAYTYASIADVGTNRPSTFSRVLESPTQVGAAWNAFLAVGDVWRVRPNLQVQYGVRGEATTFLRPPRYNPVIDSLFDVRTDNAPRAVSVGPRAGFVYGVQGSGGSPIGFLRGGAGNFRNLIDPSLLSLPTVSTGLPRGMTQISCVGSAVPVPDWAAFATGSSAIPTACANAGPGLTDASPQVVVVAPRFSAANSWRGNLAWSSTALHSAYTVEATVSRNLNQGGRLDLNLADRAPFATSDEGRPVFADPGAIVAATGAVSPVGARKSPSYASVSELVSDLSSNSRQLTFTLRPFLGETIRPYLGDLVVGYTLGSVRDELRGFDQSTFSNPQARDWARGGLDARHQLVIQGVVRPHPGWLLFFSGHVQSGMPYSPMVQTDVNGDGLANDRAFIFDPRQPGDSSVAAGMRALLADGSGSARRCLSNQLGEPAGRNSCESPWSATLNASLRLDGAQLFHRDRLAVTINLANPLGGLDYLMHGANRLHGWGTVPSPDNVLLDVRGFDPATRRFGYTVNPRFGSTSPALNTIRAPFRLTLDVSLDIAPSQNEQQLDRWLRPGRRGRAGQRVTAEDLTRRFQRTVPDPYDDVLQEADSLLVTSQQSAALRAADARYRAHIDSIWTRLGNYLGSLPDEFDARDALRRTDAATDDAWEFTRLSVQADFAQILTTDQLVILPAYSRMLFTARERVKLRIFPRGG